MRAVIDTNILFKGLTKRNSASAYILRLWQAQLFQPCVSLAVQYEYYDVLARKLASRRWNRIQPVLGTLLARAHPIVIHYRWQPSSPDPGDEKIIDCAMNARAWVVTYNLRDFILARFNLGLVVLSPQEFLEHLID